MIGVNWELRENRSDTINLYSFFFWSSSKSESTSIKIPSVLQVWMTTYICLPLGDTNWIYGKISKRAVLKRQPFKLEIWQNSFFSQSLSEPGIVATLFKNRQQNTNTKKHKIKLTITLRKMVKFLFQAFSCEGYKYLTFKGAMTTQIERNTIRIYWITYAYFEHNNKYEKWVPRTLLKVLCNDW